MRNTKSTVMRAFLAIILIFFLSACSHQADIDKQLQHAEAVMSEHPDSALSIIQSIDLATISRGELQARYALLLSQAKDKNWIDETNDSLITIATDYYSNSDNKYYDMLSQYYQGVVKFNAKDYAQSMVHLLRALESAQDLEEHFWAGMAAREISYIYNVAYNVADELKYAQIQHDHFKKSGDKSKYIYSVLGLATAYFNTNNCDDGFRFANQVLDSIEKLGDPILEEYGRRAISAGYIRSKNYGNAIEQYLILTKKGLANSNDSLSLGLCYLCTNKKNDAYKILSEMPGDSSMASNVMRYRIFEMQGDYKNAFKYLLKVDIETDQILHHRINQDLSSSIINHYNLNTRTAEAELAATKYRTGIIIMSLAILIFAILILVCIHNKRQQKKIEDNLLLAEELQKALDSKKSENSNISKSVRILLSSKHELFDKLCNLIYENGNNEIAKRRISELLNDLINQITTNHTKIEELEGLVNQTDNNLISNFKKDFPNLKELDYKIFLFTVLGFSNTTISMLCKVENLVQFITVVDI